MLSQFVDALIADPELMDLWLGGRSHAESLCDAAGARFANMCLKAFRFFSATQCQRRVGTLREDDWTEFYAVIRF